MGLRFTVVYLYILCCKVITMLRPDVPIARLFLGRLNNLIWQGNCFLGFNGL